MTYEELKKFTTMLKSEVWQQMGIRQETKESKESHRLDKLSSACNLSGLHPVSVHSIS